MPTLDWLTREADIHRASQVPYRLLEEVPKLSYGDRNTGNMLIQGDNLDALRALLPYYAGKVKCIYADPPFNTLQAFPDYDDNLEHAIWLSMIYPALETQRDLLSPEGTLVIHIDDNELGYMIAVADEIMGRKNRLAIVTFKQGSATGHKAINPGVVNTTNFILIYARSKPAWKPNRIFVGRDRDKRYSQYVINPEDHHSDWRIEPLLKAFACFHESDLPKLRKRLGAAFEDKLNEFVIDHASHVVRQAKPDYGAISELAQKLVTASLDRPKEIFLLSRQDHPDMYFINGQRLIFYKDKLHEIDGTLVAGEPLTSLWSDVLSNNLHKEGGVDLPKSKKPEALLKRVLELCTQSGDLVLDAYLGSGTTAAVAHKMSRRYVGIERGEHALSKCHPRLINVVESDQSGVSKAVGWTGGGGFRFYRLGDPVFDEAGHLAPGVRFAPLAAHLWFAETGTPFAGQADAPFLGAHDGTGYYLLYNGILGDKRPKGGNVLTTKILAALPAFAGPRIIFGEGCRLGAERLQRNGIAFRHIPYEIKAR